QLLTTTRHRVPPRSLSLLLSLVPVALPPGLARALRVGRIRRPVRQRELRAHVSTFLVERGLLSRGERAIRRRRDVLEERNESREPAPAADEVLLDDPEERRGHPVEREASWELRREPHRDQRQVVGHRLHHLL